MYVVAYGTWRIMHGAWSFVRCDMPELKLVIGSKTYSSWSLRPWLLLRYHNVAFKEVSIALNTPETRKKILEISPSGKVPVLINGPEKVWDSLAICEYAAEILKLPGAWPTDTVQRYHARSLASEMHSGFTDLRNELPMDCRRPPAPHPISAGVEADVARIREIWRGCREQYGKSGEWLFGKFSIVDAMFAPVALRFHTYAIPLDGLELEYKESMLNLPALREWLGAAMLETVRAPGSAAPAPRSPAASAPPAPAAPAPRAAAPETVALPAPAAEAPAQPARKGKAAAAESAPGNVTGAKVVSNQGGVRMVSNIIPD